MNFVQLLMVAVPTLLASNAGGPATPNNQSAIALSCGVQPKPVKSCSGCQITSVNGTRQLTVTANSQVVWQPSSPSFTVTFNGTGPCQSKIFTSKSLPCTIKSGATGSYQYRATTVGCKVPISASLSVK